MEGGNLAAHNIFFICIEKRVMHRYFFITIGLLLCTVLNATTSATEKIAVVYPDVSGAYNDVFDQIIDGIKDGNNGNVVTLSLDKRDPADKAQSWLAKNKAQRLVGLGLVGYRFAVKASNIERVLAGAVPFPPGRVSGISGTPDPSILFKHLNELAPNITSVHVVHSRASEWVVKQAKSSAGKYGLKLNAIKVKSAKHAIKTYEKVIKTINPSYEAVWIPFDPIAANEQVIIPRLLERSWEQNFVLFSSKPDHVRRGALFTLFPDLFELGRDLADMANQPVTPDAPKTVIPVKKNKLAVNMRTAAHLGFDYKNQQKRQFYLTFPK